MKSILRQVRISPKKANLVAALVRKKNVLDAIAILKFTPRKGASIIKKVLESAVANAENNFKQNRENLYVKEIIVTEGTTYKRSLPVSKGRTHPILKRTSHITVKVESTKPKTEKENKKTETVEETETTKKHTPKTAKSKLKNN